MCPLFYVICVVQSKKILSAKISEKMAEQAEGMEVDLPTRPSDEQKGKKRFEVKKVTKLVRFCSLVFSIFYKVMAGNFGKTLLLS